MADKLSRRTALSVLGFTSSAVLTGEALAQPLKSGAGYAENGFHFAINKNASDALRKLADDIDAHGTLVQNMTLTSKAQPEDFLLHTLAIEFALDVRPPEEGRHRPIG